MAPSVWTMLAAASLGAAVALMVLSLTKSTSNAHLYVPTAVRTSASSVTVAPTFPVSARNTRLAALPEESNLGVPVVDEAFTTTASTVNVQAPAAAFVALTSLGGALLGYLNAKWTPATTYAHLMDVEAEGLSRRRVLATGLAATGMGIAMQPQPANAAYGEGANVFGKKKDSNQFYQISGDGWSGIMPGKYIPSKEREFPGTVARWEDNFDSISCSSVTIVRGVATLGPVDDVRRRYVEPLLGQQSFQGDTISEGGFAQGKVASSALLDQQVIEKNGKTYYEYELLTRTADGDEGGKHQLFQVTVGRDGLYILKHQAGDKRWFKGLEKPIRESLAAFTVE